jgi:hypothetical protein
MIGVFNASKYPNVAAAKLAAMHGCEVYTDFDLFTPILRKAYISAIFSWERDKAMRIGQELADRATSVQIGGTGWSSVTDPDIEDYPQEYINLARWCNKPQSLWSMDFSEYQRDYRKVKA